MLSPHKVFMRLLRLLPCLSLLSGCLLVGYEAMPGKQTSAFRDRLHKSKCRMRVVKNTLARVAFEKAGLSTLTPHLKGNSALLYGEGEAILPLAQAVAEWNKDKTLKPVVVKAGLMGRAPLTPKDVERLASIPPRQVLLAQVARGVNAPLQQLACALAGVPRKLAYAIKAVADQKAKGAAA